MTRWRAVLVVVAIPLTMWLLFQLFRSGPSSGGAADTFLDGARVIDGNRLVPIEPNEDLVR